MPPSINSTIWDLDPHTVAKHKILQRYLQAWLPIISKFKRANYIDGFAGPGVYSKEEEGSPIIALRAAIEHKIPIKAEIGFIFIELRRDRADFLKNILHERFSNIPKNFEWEVVCAEFASSVERILNEIEGKGAKLAPTFAFLDPFGFKGLPMELIKRILTYKSCEVLITFMEGFVNRFTDELREDALDELYETEEWRKIREIQEPEERKRFFIELYEKQLTDFAGARYVRSFEMEAMAGQTLYYLVFATNHPKGVEVMKEAMWKADPTGNYRFSDRTDPNQKLLLDYTDTPKWVSDAAKLVAKKFSGQKVSREKIWEYTVTETPYLFRISILKKLEDAEKIIGVKGRQRKGTFPDGCVISFKE